MLKRQEKIEILNAIQGWSQVMNEMVAGRIDVASDTLLVMLPHVKSGKVTRSWAHWATSAPGYNFPTVAESLPGMSAESGTGLVVLAGTPDAIVRKIAASVAQVRGPAGHESAAGRASASSPSAQRLEGFDEYLRMVTQRWGKLIVDQRITLE